MGFWVNIKWALAQSMGYNRLSKRFYINKFQRMTLQMYFNWKEIEYSIPALFLTSQMAQQVKSLPAMQKTQEMWV